MEILGVKVTSGQLVKGLMSISWFNLMMELSSATQDLCQQEVLNLDFRLSVLHKEIYFQCLSLHQFLNPLQDVRDQLLEAEEEKYLLQVQIQTEEKVFFNI